MARTVGIGIQSFEKIIKNNNFYIDKTGFIKEWWESDDDVTLITRPRRFGKTLNMSMTEQFFSVKYAGCGELFEGLSIWQEEKYQQLQGTYPVISISFANVKETNYEDTRKKICSILTEPFIDNSFLLEDDLLDEKDREFFRKISMDMDDVSATLSLHYLSKYLYLYYGKKVIILLDEYDTPMQEAYINGFWEEMVSFTRSLFNSTFKTNPWLERAVMTGITRISKESIFSDLNNLKVITTTSDKYETIFGFTENEVFHALEEFGMSDRKDEVKEWYDGFIFGKISDIYNPWSILNYLDAKKIGIYWANTSSNSLVGKLIREGSPDVKIVMEGLLQGKAFHAVIDEQIVFHQLDYADDAIWSLLLTSGYLKAETYQMNLEKDQEEYDLVLTNREVRVMFKRMINGWFARSASDYNTFIKALLAGDLDAMNEYMNRVASDMFSYFDTGKRPSGRVEPERFYHGFVLGLMVDLADRYALTSNRESGFGRYDIMLEPHNKEDHAFILEFKVFNPRRDKNLEDTAAAALQQIEDKKYAAVLEGKGFAPDKIRKYGFAFEGKEVWISGQERSGGE